MNRTAVMVGVLVVLIGIAVYVWSTSEGTQVDPKFAEMKQGYNCPHCGKDFELTGSEITSMIEKDGGITCPFCQKKIDDYISTKSSSGTLGGDYDQGSGDAGAAEENVPPRAVGDRKRVKN